MAKLPSKIPALPAQSSDHALFKLFQFNSNDVRLIGMVPEFMQRYNLLPNDAIIVGTCKLHGITQPACHGEDFIGTCKGEGITLSREE